MHSCDGMCSHGLPLSGGSKLKPKPKSSRIKQGGNNANTKSMDVTTDSSNSVISGVVDGIRWDKTGTIGNTCLNVYLQHGQCIVCDGGNMLFMNADIDLKTNMTSKPNAGKKKPGFFNSFKKGVARSLANESFFQNFYTRTNIYKEQRISFGLSVPGEFMLLNIQPGDENGWKLNHGAFVAGTTNVIVSGKLNWRALIGVGQDNSAFATTLRTTDRPGSAWIATYGSIERHDIPLGESLLVNNEHFLACPYNQHYEISKVGKKFKSLFFSGEGFGMLFKGPCTLYTQTKGIIRLARELSEYMPSRCSGGSSVGFGIGEIAEEMFD